MTLRFTWNSTKAEANLRKHAVSFDEASSVFRDVTAYIFDDDEHSGQEHREMIIGNSDRKRLLIVIFTERDNTVRIISARRATQREKDIYEKAQR